MLLDADLIREERKSAVLDYSFDDDDIIDNIHDKRTVKLSTTSSTPVIRIFLLLPPKRKECTSPSNLFIASLL